MTEMVAPGFLPMAATNAQITLEDVKSSNVSRLGYDAKSCHLYVEFRNKSLYRYHNIQQGQFHDLRNAESIGSHLSKHIKNQDIFCEKIDPAIIGIRIAAHVPLDVEAAMSQLKATPRNGLWF